MRTLAGGDASAGDAVRLLAPPRLDGAGERGGVRQIRNAGPRAQLFDMELVRRAIDRPSAARQVRDDGCRFSGQLRAAAKRRQQITRANPCHQIGRLTHHVLAVQRRERPVRGQRLVRTPEPLQVAGEPHERAGSNRRILEAASD